MVLVFFLPPFHFFVFFLLRPGTLIDGKLLRRLAIDNLEGPPSVTMNQYPRSLQTVLDDTLGCHKVSESFENEPSSEGSIVGQVRGHKSGNLQPVYSATRLGPDLSIMRGRDRLI